MIARLPARLQNYLRQARPLPADHRFIWSKGFALLADVPGPVAGARYITGDWNTRFPADLYREAREGDVVWVRSNHVGRFASEVFPRLRGRITLVSGDEDVAQPRDPALDGNRYGLPPPSVMRSRACSETSACVPGSRRMPVPRLAWRGRRN